MIALSACSGGQADNQPVETTLAVEETTTSIDTTASTEPSAPENPLIVVPDLSGLNEDQAFEVLRAEGLFAKFSEVESAEREGSVALQTPRAGSEVEEGETVEVFIAIPQTHVVDVELVIRDELWDDLPNGECEKRDLLLYEGQSVSLVGPNGETLGTAAVKPGEVVTDDRQDPPEDVCLFVFYFADIPEVVSYGLESANYNWPRAPISILIESDWFISWDIFKG